ncbi:MAG: hypothetical protein HQK63_10775 [Desulfamplus sp.]|nr:hypothetical protein [Desulfamplus sp.]
MKSPNTTHDNLKYAQKDLFKYLVEQVSLYVPDSPRKTFYKLYLEFEFNNYVIRKESGIGCKVLDRRVWSYESFEKAEKSFNKRIHQKTRPDRKSSRKYIEIKAES